MPPRALYAPTDQDVMTKDASTILTEALQLPAKQRRKLIEELIASLDDNQDTLEAWLDVAQERAAAIDRGEASTVPWSVARQQIFGHQ